MNIRIISKLILIICITLFTSYHVIGKNARENALSEQELIQKLEKFPAYREVVTYYFENYKNPENYHLYFAKKSEGWFVYLTSENNFSDTLNVEKIWAYKKNKFKKLKKYSKLTKPKKNTSTALYEGSDKYELKQEINAFINYYDERRFDLHPFYGYIGWSSAVIKLLSTLNLTTAQMTYSLARAYSRYSSSLIRFQYGNENLKYPSASYEKIEDKRLQEYLFFANQAIEQYYKTYQLNPRLETIIGDIYTKYCNEHLFVYMNLMSLKEEQMARKYLKDSLYNQQTLAFSRNYLLSCPDNAILITNGDNDTYPLWYLQEKFGFRSDVRVVNFQLMQTDWCIDMLRNKHLKSEPIDFSFDNSKIKGNLREVVFNVEKFDYPPFYFESNEEDDTNNIPIPAITLDGFVNLNYALKIIFSDDSNHLVQAANNRYYNSISAKKYFLPVNKDFVKASSLLAEKYWNEMLDTIHFNYSSNILRNALVLMDMIAEANWKRPICFGSTNSSETFIGLSNYLMQTGMAYQLVPIKKETDKNINNDGWINSELMYENMLHNFIYPDFQDPYFVLDGSNSRQSQNMRNILTSLALQLLAESDTLKTIEVLDFSVSTFPGDHIQYEISAIRMLETYYILSEFDKGDGIAVEIMQSFKKTIEEIKKSETSEISETMLINYGLKLISALSQRYTRPTISEKSERLMEEIYRL